MSTFHHAPGRSDSVRHGAQQVGGVVLLVLGALSIAVALVGSIFAGSGVAFLPLALPLLVAGYVVLRAIRGARVLGLSVAVIYGVAVGYVATTPLRGLTPAPGQSVAIDPGSGLVAAAFLTAALLLLVGRADREGIGR